MSNLGCFMYMTGVLLCGPEHKVVHTYVAGEKPRMVNTKIILLGASDHHQELWGALTDEKLEAAFADWGPRRYIPIDWSKVRGVKAP